MLKKMAPSKTAVDTLEEQLDLRLTNGNLPSTVCMSRRDCVELLTLIRKLELQVADLTRTKFTTQTGDDPSKK